MARPEGFERALVTYEILIEGRDEWLTAAKARSADPFYWHVVRPPFQIRVSNWHNGLERF
jgi:hypothetical protein